MATAVVAIVLAAAHANGQTLPSGDQGAPREAKEWSTPDAPAVANVPYPGSHYESLVPDTLDVAEMARLAIDGLTGPLDPADDYSLYWIKRDQTRCS